MSQAAAHHAALDLLGQVEQVYCFARRLLHTIWPHRTHQQLLCNH
jgi:hypothetical protein